MIPGERFIKDGEIELNAGRKTVTLTVANSGDRPIQVGSHYHFFETNPALKFERRKARGMRLDIAAGTAVRIVLIPGIERTIQGKHVLLLNYASGAGEVRSFTDLAALKRSQPGGLVVAPHPYFPAPSCLWGLLEDHEDLFDAVEVNGMFTESVDFNSPARRWARATGTPLVGNGDIHRLTQLGTTYSLVDAPVDADADAICAAIAAGKVDLVAHPHSWRTVGRLLSEIVLASVLPTDWTVRTPSADAA